MKSSKFHKTIFVSLENFAIRRMHQETTDLFLHPAQLKMFFSFRKVHLLLMGLFLNIKKWNSLCILLCNSFLAIPFFSAEFSFWQSSYSIISFVMSFLLLPRQFVCLFAKLTAKNISTFEWKARRKFCPDKRIFGAFMDERKVEILIPQGDFLLALRFVMNHDSSRED